MELELESEIQFIINECDTGHWADDLINIAYETRYDFPTIGVTSGHEYCEIQLTSQEKIDQVIHALEACKKELKIRQAIEGRSKSE